MNFSIIKHRSGRFNFTYTVYRDDVTLVREVPYLQARKALHAVGVSGEKWLDRLDRHDGQVVDRIHFSV